MFHCLFAKCSFILKYYICWFKFNRINQLTLKYKVLWGRKYWTALVNCRLDYLCNIPRHSLKSLYQLLQTCSCEFQPCKVTFDATEGRKLLWSHIQPKSTIWESWNMELILWIYRILHICQMIKTSKILLKLSAFIFATRNNIGRGKFTVFRPLKIFEHLFIFF